MNLIDSLLKRVSELERWRATDEGKAAGYVFKVRERMYDKEGKKPYLTIKSTPDSIACSNRAKAYTQRIQALQAAIEAV